jgi:hypothetical protein
MGVHREIRNHTDYLIALNRNYRSQQERLRNLERYFVAFMSGKMTPRIGDENFAQFLVDVIGDGFVGAEQVPILHLYVLIVYGDPQTARAIPGLLSRKHWYQDLERAYYKSGLNILTIGKKEQKKKRDKIIGQLMRNGLKKKTD